MSTENVLITTSFFFHFSAKNSQNQLKKFKMNIKIHV